MTVSVIDGQLKVILTETETVRFNIDRIFFEKNDTVAEKELSVLLRSAAAKVGYNSAATCFLIELYPVFEGGCEVWFIPKFETKAPAKLKTTGKKSAVFEFESTDSMMSACEELYLDLKTRYCVSTLLKYNDRYRLIVSGVGQAACRRLAFNFADRYWLSLTERAKSLEHGKIICPKNAIAIVGQALCKRGNNTL